ncbi:MAG TPA: winged-helix domain-containing protein [Thermoanaerobaculia bacterium]|nr:winged-helix domain-containing protein [Thermoanaerobaculia bacterium]
MRTLRTLNRLLQELESRPGAEDATVHARLLVAYLAELHQKGEVLATDGPKGKSHPAPRRRSRPKIQDRTRRALLAVLEGRTEPQQGVELQRELAAGYEELTRQAIGYHLKRLERAGVVKRVPAPEGRPVGHNYWLLLRDR